MKQHHVTAQADRIPFFQKAIYGVGSFVNQFQQAALGQLITVLNVGLGMNPVLVGWIGAVPRFIDAFSDPLIGYSSDNTRTKYGRRRPWIFFGAIISGILFSLMFQLYKGHSEYFYFGYFLVIQVLFIIAFACFSIPWIAFGYEMTPDYHERTRLQAYASFFAQPVWMISPWFFSIMSNKRYFPDIVSGARTLAIAVGALILIGGLLPAVFNKEIYSNLLKPKEEKGYKHVIGDIFNNLKDSFKCRPFVKLCVVTFLIFNGFMLATSFTFYVICFYIFHNVTAPAGTPLLDAMFEHGGKLLGLFGTFSSVCAFGVIPLTSWISSKIGKKRAFLLTMCLAMVGYAIKWIGYNPNHPYILLFAAPFVAFHLGSLFTIVPSMVADVCDWDELQCGKRREGMYSGIYWWVLKLGMAGAAVLGGYLLNWTGFNIKLGVAQTPNALLMMRLCDVCIPIVTTAIAIFVIMTFEVSEEKAYEIRKQLEEKRGK